MQFFTHMTIQYSHHVGSPVLVMGKRQGVQCANYVGWCICTKFFCVGHWLGRLLWLKNVHELLERCIAWVANVPVGEFREPGIAHICGFSDGLPFTLSGNEQLAHGLIKVRVHSATILVMFYWLVK